MKKLTFWMLGILVMMATAVTTADAQELVTTNPGFEDAALAAPWTIDGTCPTCVLSTAEKHAGAQSLYLAAGSKLSYDKDPYDFADLLDFAYVISFWYKTDAAAINTSELTLAWQAMNPGGYAIQRLPVEGDLSLPDTGGEWKQFTYTLLPPEFTVSSRSVLQFSISPADGIWIDDVSFVKGPGKEVESVTLDWTTKTLAATQSAILVATVLPADALGKTLTWTSSDETVASVYNGNVTAIAEGTATITATSKNGTTASATVTVTPEVKITGLTLDKSTLTMKEGDEPVTLVATLTPANATNQTLSWSSDASSVSVDYSTGVVTPQGYGTATVTVTAGVGDNQFKASCFVTVLPKNQADYSDGNNILTDPSFEDGAAAWEQWGSLNAELMTGEEGMDTHSGANSILMAEYGSLYQEMPMYDFANFWDKDFTLSFWYKTIDGSATLTSSFDAIENNGSTQTVGKALSLELAESNNQWTFVSVAIAPDGNYRDLRTEYKGLALTLYGTGLLIDDLSLVSAQGVPVPVTAIAPLVKKCIVAWDGNPNSTVSVPEFYYNMFHKTVHVTPANARNQVVTWSVSNPAILDPNSTDPSNVMRGQFSWKILDYGTVTLTATSLDGSKTATMEVTIIDQYDPNYVATNGIYYLKNAEGKDPTREDLTLAVGQTFQFYTEEQKPANATYKDIEWYSENPSVVTVDQNGLATVVAENTEGSGVVIHGRQITLSGDGATATIRTTRNSVTAVILDRKAITMAVSEKDTLSCSFTPANTTFRNVQWKSSNPEVAQVQFNGEITARSVGTATITATSIMDDWMMTPSEYFDECVVTVSEAIAVESISLNKTALELDVEDEETLIATIAPADATDKNVIWSSSDNAVATVDAAGKVTAVAAGTVTITVASIADATKTATCTVTVKQKTGISDVSADDSPVISTRYYNIVGQEVSSPVAGQVYVLKELHESGKVTVRKTIINTNN